MRISVAALTLFIFIYLFICYLIFSTIKIFSSLFPLFFLSLSFYSFCRWSGQRTDPWSWQSDCSRACVLWSRPACLSISWSWATASIRKRSSKKSEENLYFLLTPTDGLLEKSKKIYSSLYSQPFMGIALRLSLHKKNHNSIIQKNGLHKKVFRPSSSHVYF